MKIASMITCAMAFLFATESAILNMLRLGNEMFLLVASSDLKYGSLLPMIFFNEANLSGYLDEKIA